MATSTIQSLLNEAIQLERKGRWLEACAKLREAIGAGGQSSLALDARLRLGRLLIYYGEGSAAEQETSQVLTEARQLGAQGAAPSRTAVAVHLLALSQWRHARYEAALRLLDESAAKDRTETLSPETAQWYHYRGLILADQGHRAEGERLLFRALQIYHEVHDAEGRAQVFDSLGNLLLRHGKTRPAVEFVKRSLELKRRLSDRYGEAVSLGTLGRCYFLQARYDDAAQMFAEDLAIARELGDVRAVGHLLNLLGQVACACKELDKAVNFHRQSLEANPGPYNAAHAYLGLAWAQLLAGRLDEATSACDQTASCLAQYPGARGLPDAHLGLRGALAARQGHPEQGERMLQQANQGLVRQGLTLETIPYLYELRDLYETQGRKSQAVQTMAQALNLLYECGAERGVVDLEKWLRTVDSPSLTQLALEQHVPRFLTLGILGGQLLRPPTRKQQVAVLFCDIRDYTTLSEGLPAEDVVEILNEWFTEATRVICRRGGVVDKFIGDAVMAVFGVPESRGDAAADAVQAALDLREELFALNLRQKALDRKEIAIGVGIDTGEVVVGFIGSHLRQSYTVIGDTVNVASRLESETKNFACDILISGETQAQQEAVQVAETLYRGDREVKGRKQPVAVYQVKRRLQRADTGLEEG
jgi:class 3 adenylate cyclase